MRSEDEIRKKIIELYEKFVKSFGDQFNGAEYGIKREIDILKWVLQEDNQ